MLDAVQLLEKSKAFTTKDSKQLKAWFGKLLTWILNSPQGQEEANQANNHSTAHDAQVIAFALYAGNVKVAQEVINAIPQRRIFTQIEPDGRQPHELRRTLAFGYSQFNLSHFIDIFLMAQKIGISIDNATSTDGRNFYKAMDFLAPYVGKDVKDWPYQQISEWDYKQQEFCKDLYRVFLLNPERKTPPYFLAQVRPNIWSSSLMVPPTAHRELWQLVSTYGTGNFSSPEALDV